MKKPGRKPMAKADKRRAAVVMLAPDTAERLRKERKPGRLVEALLWAYWDSVDATLETGEQA